MRTRRYVAIALDSTIEQMPWWMCGTLSVLSARADDFVLHGLPLQLFDLERSVLAAFRTLQGGTNTGKVVVRIPQDGADAATRGPTLISGGTRRPRSCHGCVALASAVPRRWCWLPAAARVTASGQREAARRCRVCSFSVVRCDAAELMDTRRMVGAILAKAHPAGGRVARGGRAVGQAACAQRAATVKRVFAPKVAGAWALQQVAASSPLDACVLFSSIAALIGGGGQSNYAAANGCLDALGACRRVRAMNATSVQWGPWAAAGMAADASVNARIQASGIGLISLEQGTLALQATLQPCGVGVMSFRC